MAKELVQKVHPTRAFITAGPGEVDGKFYAALMVRKQDVPVDADVKDQYDVMVKGTKPFDTADEAKLEMAQRYPAIAVHDFQNEEGIIFIYPCWTQDLEHASRFVKDAAAKRQAKDERRYQRHLKSLEGQVRARFTIDEELEELANYEKALTEAAAEQGDAISPEESEHLVHEFAWARGRQLLLQQRKAEEETARNKRIDGILKEIKRDCDKEKHPRKKQRGGRRKARQNGTA